MKIGSILLLIVLSLSLSTPLTLHISIPTTCKVKSLSLRHHKGHGRRRDGYGFAFQKTGLLSIDVCNASGPALSSNSDIPAIHECPCKVASSISIFFYNIFDTAFHSFLIAYRKDHPPKYKMLHFVQHDRMYICHSERSEESRFEESAISRR